MNAELDYDLSPDQWETLKALRGGATQRRAPSPFVVAQLDALGLVASSNDGALITPTGRKVLIRGSSRLWEDVAA
jgi:ribosomal protein S19E (S16A)